MRSGVDDYAWMWWDVASAEVVMNPHVLVGSIGYIIGKKRCWAAIGIALGAIERGVELQACWQHL